MPHSESTVMPAKAGTQKPYRIPAEKSLGASLRWHDGLVAGFTLIEVLVVIVIISIVSTFALLSISSNPNKKIENIANQLVNILSLAETESMLRPATLGFVVQKNTYQFYEFHTVNNPKVNPWQALSGHLLGLHSLPSDIQITLKIQNETASGLPPRLIISPSGDMTPFIILIGKKDAPPHSRISGNASGTIKSELIPDEE